MGPQPACAAPRPAAAPLGTAPHPGGPHRRHRGRGGVSRAPVIGAEMTRQSGVTPPPGDRPDPADTDPEDIDPEDADPSLVRERTELAWNRTGIAFAALGGVVLKTAPLAGLLILAISAPIFLLGRASRP